MARVSSQSLTADETYTCDVAIIGAGPAGLTVADHLRDSGLSVWVIESGGTQPTEASRQLGTEAAVIAQGPYAGLDLIHQKARGLGGTAHEWNVEIPYPDGSMWDSNGLRLAEYQRADFLANSARQAHWPVEPDAVADLYGEAAIQLGMPRAPNHWHVENGRLDFDPDALASKFFFFSPGWGVHRVLRDRVAASPTTRVVLDTTVTQLQTAEPGHVSALRLTRRDRQSCTLRATTVVLAAGGIENPRLLLDSANDRHPDGVGNAYDRVGRGFMDHPYVRGGLWQLPAHRSIAEAWAYDAAVHNGGLPRMAHLTLPSSVQEEHGLLNSAFLIFPRPHGYDGDKMRRLKAFTTGGPKALNGWRDLLINRSDVVATTRYLRGTLPGAGRGGWTQEIPRMRNWDCFEVIQLCEQQPHDENRVVLTDNRDALGCRTAQLHWSFTGEDKDSAMRSQDLVAAEIQRAGWGTYTPERVDGSVEVQGGTHHHIGTTAMSADTRHGVVDPDCRVHGIENLYVAGSSVFPTGSYANPTLTVVALAIRLARHLTKSLS